MVSLGLVGDAEAVFKWPSEVAFGGVRTRIVRWVERRIARARKRVGRVGRSILTYYSVFREHVEVGFR
jgi:hypothetical protein